MARSLIHIGDSEPSFPTPEEGDEWVWLEENRDTLLWLDTNTWELKRYNQGSGIYDISVSLVHPEGLTQTIQVGQGANQVTFTFTNGILTNFEE